MPATSELTIEICRRLIEGESLRAICASEGMPSKSTVCLWLAEDEGFRAAYASARLHQAEFMADDITDIADDGRNDWMERQDDQGEGWRLNGEHVQRSKLRIDARKWLASKLAPKKYGDATLLKHANHEGGEVRSLTHEEMMVRLASLAGRLSAQAEEK